MYPQTKILRLCFFRLPTNIGVYVFDVIDLAILKLGKSEFAEAVTKTSLASREATLKELSEVIEVHKGISFLIYVKQCI